MIKAAIAGYGNLGKSLRRAIENSDDYALVGIFFPPKPESAVVSAPWRRCRIRQLHRRAVFGF